MVGNIGGTWVSSTQNFIERARRTRQQAVIVLSSLCQRRKAFARNRLCPSLFRWPRSRILDFAVAVSDKDTVGQPARESASLSCCRSHAFESCGLRQRPSV